MKKLLIILTTLTLTGCTTEQDKRIDKLVILYQTKDSNPIEIFSLMDEIYKNSKDKVSCSLQLWSEATVEQLKEACK